MPEINICIDIDRLRADLKQELQGAYYGGGFGAAMMQAMDLDQMSPQKVADLAQEHGFNIRDYEVK